MRVGLVAALVVGALVAASLVLFVFVPADHPRRADAIVVLAGDRDRLQSARRAGVQADAFVISLEPGRWPAAARACAQGAICFHARPYSTQGEAEAIARLARRNGWHRIVVVTSRYHLRRARLLFSRCLPVKPQFVAASTTVFDYVRNIPWEWGKLLYQVTIDRGC